MKQHHQHGIRCQSRIHPCDSSAQVLGFCDDRPRKRFSYSHHLYIARHRCGSSMRIGTKRLLLEVPTKPIIIIIMLRVDNMDDILYYLWDAAVQWTRIKSLSGQSVYCSPSQNIVKRLCTIYNTWWELVPCSSSSTFEAHFRIMRPGSSHDNNESDDIIFRKKMNQFM